MVLFAHLWERLYKLVVMITSIYQLAIGMNYINGLFLAIYRQNKAHNKKQKILNFSLSDTICSLILDK